MRYSRCATSDSEQGDRYESFDLDLAFHVLPAAATPEPTTVALLGLGVLGLTTKRSWRRTAMKDF